MRAVDGKPVLSEQSRAGGRDLVSEDLGTHRNLPVDTDNETREQPAPSPVATRVVQGRDDAWREWADLADIAGVEAVLDAHAR